MEKKQNCIPENFSYFDNISKKKKEEKEKKKVDHFSNIRWVVRGTKIKPILDSKVSIGKKARLL